MKIFLCRHGQTTSDIEDRYGGDFEDYLTDTGREQAEGLADKLAGNNIEIIFSSPKIRAMETAELLKSKLGVEIQVKNGLRERNHYGILTGMIKAEAREKYPQEVEKVKTYLTNATGGENYEDFKVRIKSIWEEILNSGFKTAAIVSHGGPIRMLFREIFKLGELNIADCAYAEIVINEGKAKVTLLVGISQES